MIPAENSTENKNVGTIKVMERRQMAGNKKATPLACRAWRGASS